MVNQESLSKKNMGFKTDQLVLKKAHERVSRCLRDNGCIKPAYYPMLSMHLIDKLLSNGYSVEDIVRRVYRAGSFTKTRSLMVELGIIFIYNNWHSLADLNEHSGLESR